MIMTSKEESVKLELPNGTYERIKKLDIVQLCETLMIRLSH